MKILVVCARRYNGHELWTALGTMQERGHTFEVIYTKRQIMDEITFQPNQLERTIEDVSPEDFLKEFEALMIVSGNMQDTELYWTHPRVLSYVKAAQEHDLPLAAICCSVPTVRHAVKGKQVSFFPLVRSRVLLKDAGAILRTTALSVDGKLVTAEHQMATQMWAEAFCDVLEGKKDPGTKLVDSGFRPRGRMRRPVPELERIKEIQQRLRET